MSIQPRFHSPPPDSLTATAEEVSTTSAGGTTGSAGEPHVSVSSDRLQSIDQLLSKLKRGQRALNNAWDACPANPNPENIVEGTTAIKSLCETHPEAPGTECMGHARAAAESGEELSVLYEALKRTFSDGGSSAVQTTQSAGSKSASTPRRPPGEQWCACRRRYEHACATGNHLKRQLSTLQTRETESTAGDDGERSMHVGQVISALETSIEDWRINTAEFRDHLEERVPSGV